MYSSPGHPSPSTTGPQEVSLPSIRAVLRRHAWEQVLVRWQMIEQFGLQIPASPFANRGCRRQFTVTVNWGWTISPVEQRDSLPHIVDKHVGPRAETGRALYHVLVRWCEQVVLHSHPTCTRGRIVNQPATLLVSVFSRDDLSIVAVSCSELGGGWSPNAFSWSETASSRSPVSVYATPRWRQASA